jgi:hypothetical protein
MSEPDEQATDAEQEQAAAAADAEQVEEPNGSAGDAATDEDRTNDAPAEDDAV